MEHFTARITRVTVLLLLSGLTALAQQTNNLNAQQAAEFLQMNRNAVILDVRTPAEFQAGHLKNAVNINYNAPDFEQQLARLDKSKPYMVHCAAGGRSTKSLSAFQKLGFQNVRHLDGGLRAWQQAGLPVVK